MVLAWTNTMKGNIISAKAFDITYIYYGNNLAQRHPTSPSRKGNADAMRHLGYTHIRKKKKKKKNHHQVVHPPSQ
jgi:hypothetical protein